MWGSPFRNRFLEVIESISLAVKMTFTDTSVQFIVFVNSIKKTDRSPMAIGARLPSRFALRKRHISHEQMKLVTQTPH
jgi:hypothetical protein